ncbi:phosphoserine transaminase [Varunaivibrio sulfuroxidans]|uniref:phosphoserine transaminase n=1 Tax=Varunaivibrio sulfuroxidans TaxID=1773489 RepID=A0A4R3JC04_9PROT|nr:phosphoserine transaminase [Varunaivibrio sulfuroxidans]TCS63488.1 phosphoserine aminotransferase [Varunaivibrio sulfuroxidans]WES30367.1 phosphoserine transaminase [Varunaivibrio sulfuroxidans]
MTTVPQPDTRPARPEFSSGPCAKRPGWTVDVLKDAAVGRSHRSKIGKAKLAEVIDRTRAVLGVPDDYKIGIVPASDTGAVEMALWSLLGERGVDMLVWESFGAGWATDITKQLKLDDVRVMKADYGNIPDLGQVDFARDVVFAWNGTTSGVKAPDGAWIKDDRQGLTICDATSAVFAMDMPWAKLDVVTYSWQKVMGGEGQHGILILSPRAVERLENYTPAWPLPKIFRLTKGGKLIEGIFRGETINTPSMIAVEDALDGLKWAEQLGGLAALKKRSEDNLAVLDAWVTKTGWVEFLAKDPAIRSNTSVCLSVADPDFQNLDADAQTKTVKRMAALLEAEGVALDIGGYRDAPAGLRIWCGSTVDSADLKALTPWLDWAYATAKNEQNA